MDRNDAATMSACRRIAGRAPHDQIDAKSVILRFTAVVYGPGEKVQSGPHVEAVGTITSRFDVFLRKSRTISR